jgi:hypothetical protein
MLQASIRGYFIHVSCIDSNGECESIFDIYILKISNGIKEFQFAQGLHLIFLFQKIPNILRLSTSKVGIHFGNLENVFFSLL